MVFAYLPIAEDDVDETKAKKQPPVEIVYVSGTKPQSPRSLRKGMNCFITTEIRYKMHLTVI